MEAMAKHGRFWYVRHSRVTIRRSGAVTPQRSVALAKTGEKASTKDTQASGMHSYLAKILTFPARKTGAVTWRNNIQIPACWEFFGCCSSTSPSYLQRKGMIPNSLELCRKREDPLAMSCFLEADVIVTPMSSRRQFVCRASCVPSEV